MDFLFTKGEYVVDCIVCDESFARTYCTTKGYDLYVERKNPKIGIGHIYRNGKFYYITIDEEGHEVEVEIKNEPEQ